MDSQIRTTGPGRPRKYHDRVTGSAQLFTKVETLHSIVVGRVYTNGEDIRIVTGLTVKTDDGRLLKVDSIGARSKNTKRVYFTQVLPSGLSKGPGSMWSSNFKKWVNKNGSYTGITKRGANR